MTSDDDFFISAAQVRFERDPEGNPRLVLDGRPRPLGNVMAAFPLTERTRMISLRDQEGQEIGILDDVAGLDEASRQIITEELERTYFMPRIQDIFDIDEEHRVLTWEVETDRGPRTFQVRHVRQNVRKMGHRRLIIKDVDGNRYEIRDWQRLTPVARRFIEEYI